jgi:esterase/lipase superfamily enzyme
MTKRQQTLSGAVVLVGLLALRASAGTGQTKCRLRFDLKSLSLTNVRGMGLITCDNGQRVEVKITAFGTEGAADKYEIPNAEGAFSEVGDISELFGSYRAADTAAGAIKSGAVGAMTKGEVSLGLSAASKGYQWGPGIEKLVIERQNDGSLADKRHFQSRGTLFRASPPSYLMSRPPHPSLSPNSSLVQVFYATDRAENARGPLDYGPIRGTSLSFGRYVVSVPRDHRLAHIEHPSIWRFEFAENPKKHFVIVSRGAETEHAFYADAAAAVAASAGKEVFVFVHGFNVAFLDALYRTAQLAYDLEFSGAPILYSWPSNSSVADYVGDLNNNDWTVPHLKSFLESVASRTGAKTVHLIAHSMGNRALSNALAQIASSQTSKPRPHFRQVVLTAPDIDVDTFRALAVSLKSTADRVTLYASSNDKALRISKALNGYPRVGDVSGSVVIIPGVDTIDVSAVNTDFIGHSYYGDRKSLLTDMFSLLSAGKPPEQRRGLHAIQVTAGTYWKLSLSDLLPIR